MRINTIVRFSAAIAFALTVGGKAHATDYLITLKAPTVEGLDPNVSLKGYKGAFKHKPFTYLENWWTSWDELNSKVTLKEGDNVYFGPGVNIGNIEIATSGINLYGNNKDCLGWYGTDTQSQSAQTRLEETLVTGRITLDENVSNVTIAGFYFTGAGQVYANGGGNSNIQVLNNVIENINAQPNNTTEREDNWAVFYFGKAYRGSDYANAVAYNRYRDITIAHNDFRGRDIDYEADWIQVAGSCGNLHIHDNHFLYGGDGVNVFNAKDKVNILHNRFDKVGNGKKYGSATGSFAVRLFTMGVDQKYPVDVYVRHNYFDGCQGQSSKYAIIRFWNHDNSTNQHINPKWATLYINHNYFLNKTSFVNENSTQTDGPKLGLGNEPKYDHYYAFYSDIVDGDAATVDWRFNRFDHSEMEFAYLISPWDRKRLEGTGLLFPGRYYASLSGVFEHTTAEYLTDDDRSTGTQCGFYGKQHNDGTYFGGKALVKAVKDKNHSDSTERNFVGTEEGNKWTFRPSKTSTVVQSFDRDDETGDLYFIQVRNGNYGSGSTDAYGVTSNCKKPLILTKWDVKTRTASHMFLDYAGHGSNICVYRHKDQVYIMLGGNQASATSSDPRHIIIFPFVASDYNIDLRGTSFYIDKEYKIVYKNPAIEIGKTAPNGKTVQSFVYPSIDHANNLYVERQRTEGGDYFTVYEASDVFNCLYLNGGSTLPKIIGRCYIAANAEKIGSTSTSGTRPALNTYDNGFKTWDDQGFTIAGDYIYTFEGNGDDDNTHINLHKGVNGNAGDKDGAVQLINCINWRNGTFMYRRNINKHSTYNTALRFPGDANGDGKKLDGPAKKSAGEPEGIKVFRDHTGRAQLIIGVVEGEGVQTADDNRGRSYNLYAYRQKRTKCVSKDYKDGGDVIGRKLTKDAYKGYTSAIPDSKLSTGATVLSFTSSTLESQSQDFYHGNNGEARNVHATLVGEHAEYFTLTPHTSYYANGTDLSLLPTPSGIDFGSTANWARPSNRDYTYQDNLTYTPASNTAHTGEHFYERGYTLTFNPSKYLKEYDKAWIKLSSPGATDVYIPIKATYTGTVTSVENVISDNGELEVEGYYDLTGRRVVNPEGFVIVRYTNGTAEKKFIH
ncbi:MAG: hypothetical protein ACI4US_03855 [Muribaculaceae bacterium]